MISSEELKENEWYIEYVGDAEFSALVQIREVTSDHVTYLEYEDFEDIGPEINTFDHTALHNYNFLHIPQLVNLAEIRNDYPELFI